MLLWHTNLLNYEFALFLNKIYGLNLARTYNMPFDFGDKWCECPLFCYSDEMNRLTFVLIDRPQGVIPHPVFANYDKILLIRGTLAYDTMKSIFKDMNDRIGEPDETEILSHRRWRVMNQFGLGIFLCDYFDFSSLRKPSSNRYNGNGVRLTQFMYDLRDLLKEFFVILEYHLTDEDVL